MTLAFKWSRRYEGEGSPGYDQCIELLKCSLIFISAVSRRGGSARAPLIRLQSPPATGPPPPRGRAPASAAAGSTPSARSAGAPSLDHAPAVVTPAWGGAAATSELASGCGWDRGPGSCVCPVPMAGHLPTPGASAREQGHSCRSSVSRDETPAAQGCFVGWECFAELQGSGENVK